MRPRCATVRRARPLLGTLVEIRIDAAARGAERAVQHAFDAIERVHRSMSAQESTSDIARLRSGRVAGLDPWTRRVLERAAEIRAATDGLFDCCACGYALDGIAKGFAVDRAVECLQHAGIQAGVVNAGGDLRVFGERFEDIHVRPSRAPQRLVYLGRLRDAALATSANVLLVDPRRRAGRRSARGVTVIAADCTLADALTKPCLLEPGRARELAARFGAQVALLEPHPLP
jgi:thiamine biosynthesis lipoprotein